MYDTIKRYLQTGDRDFREVLKHSLWAFMMLGLAAGLQFLFDLLLARNFGAEGTGLFYLAFSVLATTALIGRLGLNRAVVRYIPRFVQTNDMQGLNGLKKTAFRLSLFISFPLGLTIFFLAPFIANDIFSQPQLVNYLRIFAIAIPPLSLIYVQAGFLRGLKSIKESMLVERVSYYALAILLLLTLGHFMGLDGVIVGFALAIFATAILGSLLIKNSLPKTAGYTLFSKKILLFVAAPLLFVEFSNQITGQLNIMILGILENPESVGVFNIALKVSMLIGVLLTGINAIATTKIAEIYNAGDSNKLELMASKTAGLALLCGTPFAVIFFMFPELILGLFGPEFTAGSTVLRILIVAQMVNLGVGAVVHLLAMTGNERALAVAIVGSVFFLNIILSITLIPLYGTIGAGLAVAISIVAKNILLLYLVKRYLNIWSLPFKAMRIWARKH